MPISLAALSRHRCAVLVAALLAVPALASAQRRAAASRVEAVVVTVPAIRVRTSPSQTSLSIDDFTQGTVFPLAPDEYQSKDWYGVMVDGRIAYLPRNAAAPRARGSRAVIAEPVEVATVTQAGAPAAAAPAPAVEQGPAAVAARPAQAEPVATRQQAPPTTQVATAQREAAQAPVSAPRQTTEQPSVATAAPATTAPAANAAAPSAEKKADQPAFNARRSGLDLSIGLLGSVTPIKSTAGLTPTAHVAGLSFVGVRFHALGLYGAPEYGQGGGYRSTMLGGGVSLDLINLHMLRVSALGGYTPYSETTMPTDTTVAPVTAKLQGPSVGGMVSIPFIGPLRLAYRGQYVMAQVAGVPTKMTRHSVGLIF